MAEARTVQVGQVVNGVKLLAILDDRATVEVDGQRQVLILGASPGRLNNASADSNLPKQIILASGPGGHFTPSGSINNHVVQFLVDTGATSVSITQAEAERIGLRYRARSPRVDPDGQWRGPCAPDHAGLDQGWRGPWCATSRLSSSPDR